MTTFDQYDHLPAPIKQALAELEDFIGDLDGKTMGTEASDGEGFIDEGTVDADDAVKAFNVLVAALPAQEWHDISTAPKDETRVLLARAGIAAIHTAFWRGGVWHCGNGSYFNNPTHWMPLPTPPVAVIADDRAGEK